MPNSLLGRAAARRSGRRVVQRKLDEDFEHGGEGTEEEVAACKVFAKIVSDLTDQAHDDLLAGRVKDWQGAKIAAFIGLLNRDSAMAVTHAASVVEERVYFLMKSASLPLKWVPQFDADMGGASFPDIVLHLPSSKKRGLVDITSDRRHILGKAGSWTTSTKYIYVAEAWFPSILSEHMPGIKLNMASGGVDDKALAAMKAGVEKERLRKAAALEKKLQDARKVRNKYVSFSAFVKGEHGGNRTEATKWMREHGLGGAKGVKAKPRKTIDIEAKRKKRKEAAKARKALMSEEDQLEQKKRKKLRTLELKEMRAAATSSAMEEPEPDEEEVAVGEEDAELVEVGGGYDAEEEEMVED